VTFGRPAIALLTDGAHLRADFRTASGHYATLTRKQALRPWPSRHCSIPGITTDARLHAGLHIL
jgi:hypothetical protein